ncbi:MAG: hypothetical protein DRP08_05785 [Candidatus Aenigmatarchaeota archaeon]|nr:MAG: hypothetical protein DRP08_05785 [Candidatus Aenigmarchaeota archaeon]
MPEENGTEVAESSTEMTELEKLRALKEDLIGEKRRERAARKAAEAEVEALKSGQLSEEQLDEYKALKEAADRAAAEKLEAKGEYDTLIAQKDEKHAEAMAAKDTELESIRTALERTVVTDRLKSLLAAQGVTDVDNAAFLLQGRHETFARAEMVDGAPTVRVVNRQDGTTVYDPDASGTVPLGLDKLVESFLSSGAGKHFIPASGDSGSGVHKAGQTTDSNGMTQAYFANKPNELQKFLAEHGKDAYYALPAK